MFESVHEKMEEIHKDVRSIKNGVEYTNGKVKRMTLALSILFAFAVGLGIADAKYLASLISFI